MNSLSRLRKMIGKGHDDDLIFSPLSLVSVLMYNLRLSEIVSLPLFLFIPIHLTLKLKKPLENCWKQNTQKIPMMSVYRSKINIFVALISYCEFVESLFFCCLMGTHTLYDHVHALTQNAHHTHQGSN